MEETKVEEGQPPFIPARGSVLWYIEQYSLNEAPAEARNDVSDDAFEAIFLATCQIKKLSPMEVRWSRRRVHAYTRHLFIYITRALLFPTWQAIGAYLDLDHSSVMYGHNRIAREREVYDDVGQDVDAIVKKVLGKE